MISLSSRRDLSNRVFMFKFLNNVIDCVDLLKRVNYREPARYPGKRISLLYPPLRRTILGANSPLPRLCRQINCCSDIIDMHMDSLGRF